METYTIKVECNNCSTQPELTIPKGQSLSDYIKNHKCPNCDCLNTMQKIQKDKAITMPYYGTQPIITGSNGLLVSTTGGSATTYV